MLDRLTDDDHAAIEKAVSLLMAGHVGLERDEPILYTQMCNVAQHHLNSGAGAQTSWVLQMTQLSDLIRTIAQTKKAGLQAMKIWGSH